MPVEQVALVEDALPVHEGERGRPRARHRGISGSRSSGASSSVAPSWGSSGASSSVGPSGASSSWGSSDASSSWAPSPSASVSTSSPSATSRWSAASAPPAPRTGVREAHQRRPQSHPRLVEPLDEAQRRQAPEGLLDLGACRLLGDAFVVTLALGVHRAKERLGPHGSGELREHLLAGDDPALLDRGRIEIEERERLPDQHLHRREVAPPEAIGRREQIEVPVGLVNELAPEAPVEGLEHVLGGDEKRVLIALVAIDVPAASEGQIDAGERLGADRVFQGGERRAHGVSGTVHSSMSNPLGTGSHSRSAAARGEHTLATALAMRPAARKPCSRGSAPVRRAVTSRSPRAPAASAARTSDSSRAWGSSGASSESTASRSGFRRRTGGRSGGGTSTERSRRIGGAEAIASEYARPIRPASLSRRKTATWRTRFARTTVKSLACW